MARIHPTACVDSSAVLGDAVEVGPYAIIESGVVLGDGCVIRPHGVIRSHTRMGRGNFVDSHAVLGGQPQDRKFDPRSRSYLLIGDENTFRESVTISRATGEGCATRVGNSTYWMANSHAGHNAVVHDDAILVNGALVAGHAEIGRGAILSGNAMVHQFCWVGERAMFQGGAGASSHVPPYVILAEINQVAGLNAVGLRRAEDITPEDRRQIREAFRLTYRGGLSPLEAVARMDLHPEWGRPARVFRDFVQAVVLAKGPCKRPLCKLRGRSRGRGFVRRGTFPNDVSDAVPAEA